jgi:hypothetical protein
MKYWILGVLSGGLNEKEERKNYAGSENHSPH